MPDDAGLNPDNVDERLLAQLVKEYVDRRQLRHQEILRLLAEDKKDHLLFKLIFEADPELKKKFVPTELPSLTELMRRIFGNVED